MGQLRRSRGATPDRTPTRVHEAPWAGADSHSVGRVFATGRFRAFSKLEEGLWGAGCVAYMLSCSAVSDSFCLRGL